MEIGKAYLMHCGDWHTFCFRVVSQISPYVYMVEWVSKITETNNGDVWHLLAGGDAKARKKASYVHYTRENASGETVPIRATLPLTIGAFEWEGALPAEEQP